MGEKQNKNEYNLPAPFEAYNGDEPFIFVSYSHSDKGIVYPEITELHNHYRIWYDEGIDPGNEWPDEVADALHRCNFFLVFISSRAVNSKNVKNEINFAIRKNKPFVAIYIEETTLPLGIELQIANIQAIMKFRMPEEMYLRKMRKTLPEETKITVVKTSSTIDSVNALHSSVNTLHPSQDTVHHDVTLVKKNDSVKQSNTIFISFAIQDINIAEKIWSTLENAGLNVFWFKYKTLHMPFAQLEAYFRKEIDNCALFIPIISKNTENRYAGNFRKQWDYAAEIASKFRDLTTFLFPIVIDNTIKIENARVPAEFKKLHWTYLLGGNLPDDFLPNIVKMVSVYKR